MSSSMTRRNARVPRIIAKRRRELGLPSLRPKLLDLDRGPKDNPTGASPYKASRPTRRAAMRKYRNARRAQANLDQRREAYWRGRH